jgi:saccharopine dehydrogenase (NAD+, L-lysine forming)
MENREGKVLIIGAGGVGSVVAHKCAQLPEVFKTIILASRTLGKCGKIARSIEERTGRLIITRQVDADDVDQLIALFREIQRPDLVINVALPYQDLTIMEACLEMGIPYLDTANYEPPDEARFCYEWQWAFNGMFRRKNLLAIAGCGFDPGVTSVYTAYARKHFFDEIHTLDIVDCNAGNHGYAFATNFDPATNIREVTQPGRFWENGRWIEIDPIINSASGREDFHQPFEFPEVGSREMYLLYHEELQALVRNIPTIKRARFWMTFGQEYLTHLRVLQNVGMTRIDRVKFGDIEIIPIDFLSVLLPDPSSLAPRYTGKTCIGCRIEGIKDGKPRKIFIYNVCDHAECHKEVGSQAISYTTGVPAMIGAKMALTGEWKGAGVFTVDQLDPDPFMRDLMQYGLPWKVLEGDEVPDIDE